MKAVQISQYGEADELKVHEVEKPQPKDNEVVVQIYDAGVNPYDWKVRKGYMKEIMPVQFPLTMGYDFAGVISEVGSKVQNFKTGDRVFGFTQGAYAEYGVCAEDKIAKIPSSMDFEVAASLPTPGLTAYQLIVDHIQKHQAQKILIHGAAGAVGSIAVQVAKSLGLTVYANAAKEDHEFLKNLGVDEVVDFKTQRFEDRFQNLDAVVDLVGGDTFERSFQCVKRGGFLITTVGPLKEELDRKFGIQSQFFLTNQSSQGLTELANLVAAGKLKPRLAEVMPLERAAEAQRLNETGKSRGKIVLRIH